MHTATIIDTAQVIEHFLELFSSTPTTTALRHSLDELAVAMSRLSALEPSMGDEDQDQDQDQDQDETHWREKARRAFPRLGFYYSAQPCEPDMGRPEVVLGDALDDLADIATELNRAKSHLLVGNKTLAISTLLFSYQTHWGSHLRSLQFFLHEKWRDTPDQE